MIIFSKSYSILLTSSKNVGCRKWKLCVHLQNWKYAMAVNGGKRDLWLAFLHIKSSKINWQSLSNWKYSIFVSYTWHIELVFKKA